MSASPWWKLTYVLVPVLIISYPVLLIFSLQHAETLQVIFVFFPITIGSVGILLWTIIMLMKRWKYALIVIISSMGMFLFVVLFIIFFFRDKLVEKTEDRNKDNHKSEIGMIIFASGIIALLEIPLALFSYNYMRSPPPVAKKHIREF